MRPFPNSRMGIGGLDPCLRLRWAAGFFWLTSCLIVSSFAAESTNLIYRPMNTAPGGLDPRPFITAIGRDPETTTLEWSGFLPPFTVQRSDGVAPGAVWESLLTTNASSASIPSSATTTFLRLEGAQPNYLGVTNLTASCRVCHREVHAAWTQTAHARAFETLRRIGQHKNSRCLPCHTVGYGQATGYQDEETTPYLSGVQCENCHGPAGNHLANISDPSVRPQVTPAAEVCGGCHNDFHHPTYDEWRTAGHAAVTPATASYFRQYGESRMLQCGPCHSGAVRLALLDQLEHPERPLPNRDDAAYFSVTCAVCHNPHDNTLASQTRNPTYSLIPFSYSTSTNTDFATQYAPDVQLCGQCHNLRGGFWTDNSRPPHHSPQYNMLIGNGGYDLGVSIIATHGESLQKQCAHCHTHPHEADEPSEEDPNYTGHGFVPVIGENCAECHGEGALDLTEFIQGDIRRRIGEIKSLLDEWATNSAPIALRSKYGPYTWEYSSPGQISNPTGDPSVKGPTSAEQTDIPDAIKQARFNIYLVEHDGSFGVHNGPYAKWLLRVARTNVVNALAQ